MSIGNVAEVYEFLNRAVLDHRTKLWQLMGSPSLFTQPRLLPEILTMVRAFERESRIRELIQLFVCERDPEKLKILAAELQRLLTLEGTVPKIWRE